MSFSVLLRWLFSLKLGRQVTFPATIILQISMRSLQSGEFCHRSWGCANFSVYPRGQRGSDRNTVRVVCLWLILDSCVVSSGASHVRIPTSFVTFVGSFSFSITIMLPAIVEQCNGKWTGSRLEFLWIAYQTNNKQLFFVVFCSFNRRWTIYNTGASQHGMCAMEKRLNRPWW